MKRRNIILILVLLGVGVTYLISTLIVTLNSIAKIPELVYYDSLSKTNVSGTWNMSDATCVVLLKEYQNDPIIPRTVIRRCFIKSEADKTTG